MGSNILSLSLSNGPAICSTMNRVVAGPNFYLSTIFSAYHGNIGGMNKINVICECFIGDFKNTLARF
jgi:hypothetical protein